MKIVKYGSSWCGPCRLATKTLQDSGLPFEDVDIDDNPEAAGDIKITRIPHIVFMDDNNNVIHTHIGALTKPELDKIIEDYAR